MKTALLVIDIQKAFFQHSPETAQSLNQAIVAVNAAIELFRQKDLPVICIRHINKAAGVTPDSDGFAVPEHLNILPSDAHFDKTYGNAFNKTALAEHLRKNDVDTLIICGYCAEYCVLSTYRGALDLDFSPILLRGAIASRAPQNIPFVENVNDIISLGALKHFLA